MPKELHEFAIRCEVEEKDLYLYYYLQRKAGQSAIIFCNSITCVKRTASVLEFLKVKNYALHSKMQQKQRLKSLDRFKSLSKNGDGYDTCPAEYWTSSDKIFSDDQCRNIGWLHAVNVQSCQNDCLFDKNCNSFNMKVPEMNFCVFRNCESPTLPHGENSDYIGYYPRAWDTTAWFYSFYLLMLNGFQWRWRYVEVFCSLDFQSIVYACICFV